MTDTKHSGWVKDISLSLPSLEDNTADTERLISALKNELQTDYVDIDLDIVKTLPVLLREANYKVRCVLFKDRETWRVIGVKKTGDCSMCIGIAVDLGTTTVVLRFLDLVTGNSMAESSIDNPQISIGPDILTRIHIAENNSGLKQLNGLIIDGLNNSIEKTCISCNIKTEDIYLICIAGNTAMTHLFMCLNPAWLIREPYIPVINRPGLQKARELGIKVNYGAKVFIFPNIGSYFGGDLIAGILFSGMHKHEQTAILVDVGTNAEVVLGNKNWLMGCAGAAGSALESGAAKIGMMADQGAIDKVSINPDTGKFNLHVIMDVMPKGICGSGLIDLAASLFLSGMIDIRGKLAASACGNKITKKDGMSHFIVADAHNSATGYDLTISQAEIDSLIRSKAAMYTILETISNSIGISFSELATFYVAGTFGSLINPKSAISIGMLPDLPINTYKTLGNSSIGGAAMVITDSTAVEEINSIENNITYLELNVNQEFMNRFSAAKFLPHTDLSRFPSVKPNIAKVGKAADPKDQFN